MKLIAKLFSILCIASVVSFADTWSGKLVDANCQPAATQSKGTSVCEASPSSTSFAVQTADGKILKLDSSGNSKVTTGLRTHGIDAKDARVKVSGTMDSQGIKVDSIDFENAKR